MTERGPQSSLICTLDFRTGKVRLVTRVLLYLILYAFLIVIFVPIISAPLNYFVVVLDFFLAGFTLYVQISTYRQSLRAEFYDEFVRVISHVSQTIDLPYQKLIFRIVTTRSRRNQPMKVGELYFRGEARLPLIFLDRQLPAQATTLFQWLMTKTPQPPDASMVLQSKEAIRGRLVEANRHSYPIGIGATVLGILVCFFGGYILLASAGESSSALDLFTGIFLLAMGLILFGVGSFYLTKISDKNRKAIENVST
jgi:hypothetical protein